MTESDSSSAPSCNRKQLGLNNNEMTLDGETLC